MDTEHSPYYCGYCKCDPCQCNGHGDFNVTEEALEERRRIWMEWYKREIDQVDLTQGV